MSAAEKNSIKIRSDDYAMLTDLAPRYDANATDMISVACRLLGKTSERRRRDEVRRLKTERNVRPYRRSKVA